MKNENISKKSIKDSRKPVSNVRSYFTKEIMDQIAEMDTKEMESVMKELITTRYWIAMLKYAGMRTPLLDASLRSTDPLKDASKISWSQGALAGLSDIEGYVIELNNPTPKSESEEEESSGAKPEGVIIGE